MVLRRIRRNWSHAVMRIFAGDMAGSFHLVHDGFIFAFIPLDFHLHWFWSANTWGSLYQGFASTKTSSITGRGFKSSPIKYLSCSEMMTGSYIFFLSEYRSDCVTTGHGTLYVVTHPCDHSYSFSPDSSYLSFPFPISTPPLNLSFYAAYSSKADAHSAFGYPAFIHHFRRMLFPIFPAFQMFSNICIVFTIAPAIFHQSSCS